LASRPKKNKRLKRKNDLMHSFELLSQKFALHFEQKHFPSEPTSLYEPNEYFLKMGGKRIRPVLCLMGNELFDEIKSDAWEMATAIELFHNFTLIHDDIMDKAPLRRGMETIHSKYGVNTALLAGDVMLIAAYELMNNISLLVIRQVQNLFNTTAKEVCQARWSSAFVGSEIYPSYMRSRFGQMSLRP